MKWFLNMHRNHITRARKSIMLDPELFCFYSFVGYKQITEGKNG